MTNEQQQQGKDDLLKDILLKREQREAAEFEKKELSEADEKHRKEVIGMQRESDDAANVKRTLRIQANCDHRKGTVVKHKGVLRAKQIDFMVNHHVFSNGQQRVKCEKCSMKWYPGDTKEYLLRPVLSKTRVPNHTRDSQGVPIGWREALWMASADNTTNTRTTAERIVQVITPPDAEVPKTK